ncbi:MAG: photosystem II stability/assembly factor-like uncharacterized protein [Saprospiraceae bacterium]|jgi:photosystem II stability/assembly factor-like uncharacterized protein
MKKLFLSAIALLFFACTHVSETTCIESDETTPHDFMFMQRAYPSGQLKKSAYREAVQWKKQNLAQRQVMTEVWEFVGPLNTGGRVTDIEIPVNDANTYYVGAASGGIFKTIDGGTTFNPIFDDQEMLSIGDMELSKNNPNTIWVGTGEVNAGGGSLAYDGDGVYRSTDAGMNWESRGLPNVGSIGKVLIDPTTDDTVFVAAMGPLFKNDPNRGVYKTTDGGASWNQVLFISDVTGIIDMAMHPSDGNIIYAAAWQRERSPTNRIYGGEESGLYRSLDGGSTWSEMTNGLPVLGSEKGRISIAISQSNPTVLYTRYADATGNIQGVYRSEDGGDSWENRNSSQLTNVGFHWWFRGIYIDPTNENIIYNVDFQVQKSTNGGASWSSSFGNVHVDQHAMAFSPTNPDTILLGNDGGLYQSENGGNSSLKFSTLPITQLYRLHVDAQDNNKIYAGAQDNNTIRTTTGETDNWSAIFGGDGFQPLVDPSNTNVIYALSQRGNLGKSINNGASFSVATNGIANGDRKNWDTPIVLDPSDSQTLYYGANRLYKSTNAAGSWTAISPDLTDGPYTGNLTFGTIISISVSTLDSNVIYVGTDDGNVWTTANAGVNWNNISVALPNRWVTSVLADPENVDAVYVTYSGYRFGDNEGHVYKSENSGLSWEDISVGIPDIPINDIVKDSYGNLFVATDVGVVASANDGDTWNVLAPNLPSVPVTDMHIHEASEYLYVATYGRSSYKINIAEDILDTANSSLGNTVALYPNPTNDIVVISFENEVDVIGVALYDALGRNVLQKAVQTIVNKATLNLSELPMGLYYVVLDIEGVRTIQKLIKK